MATPSTTASTLVFNTPELLELILSHLSLLETIRLAPTSLKIHNLVFTSPALKRKLFLTQPRLEDLPPEANNIFDDDGTPPSPPSPSSPLQGPMYTHHLDITLFNPALYSILPGLTLRHLGAGWILCTFGSIHAPKPAQHSTTASITPSYTTMLLTAQPLTQLRIEPAALHTDASATTALPLRPLPSPDPTEAARIQNLHQRLSHRRENSPRFGGPGERAPCLPVQTTLRWAAARGEASADGWVWGSSLEFVRGKRVPDFGETESFVVDKAGVRVGDVVRVVGGVRWGWWVIRKEG